ncbi:RNA polymerase I associated factor, A49-like protein [Naematelia encephala]|uniref:RNA polymerase I associated factor, A49-like protein n=1 Tax=Naematelia encephala TaxID=71784 RepID=A0A1Y2AT29_9TREE|nr:RNA polymerase I associated factor, A49-like protein [Naematelia encephala]
MSSQDINKKKRKSTTGHDSVPSKGDVRVVVGESSTGAGPVFANFPSVRPSKTTPFTVYSRDPSGSTDLPGQRTMLAGETEDVEYYSSNRDKEKPSDGLDCQYVPAVYDPSTRTLSIHPSAPLYLMTHRVKRLKAAALYSATPPDARAEWRAKRNDLGEAFGTRKAKTQIKADERNKVDVGAMQGVKGHLMEMIGEKPVIDEGPVKPSDLIPVPDIETSEVDKVYTRESLLPASEYSAIDVTALVKASDDRGRTGALPWRRSRFIEDKMRSIVNSAFPSSTKRANLRMCYYLSSLLAFLDLSPRLPKMSSSELPSKLSGMPPQLINGLISRFAETTGKKHQVTDTTRTKLLMYICCTYLYLDGWSVEIGKVAADLKLSPTKVGDMFKSLGCQVIVASPEERERQGLNLVEAQKNKRAVLKAPVVFPKQKLRGPIKR